MSEPLKNLDNGTADGAAEGLLKKMCVKMASDPELVDPNPRNLSRIAGLVLLGGCVVITAVITSPTSPMATALFYVAAILGSARFSSVSYR